MSLKDRIIPEKLPAHVAIIMDGNGRWAKQQGEERIFGHQHGVRAVRDTVEAAAELGIPYLTLYAFSTENWSRPKEEVDALMSLLVQTIHSETPTLNKNDIRLQTIGDTQSLPTECRNQLLEAIAATANNRRMTLVLALSYSSKWEITEAAKRIAHDVQEGRLDIDAIDERTISDRLTTAGMPDPELLIRTSGEYRISNFLLWQIAYAELHFTEKLWPQFGKEDLYQALLDFQKRERRFGRVSEQLQP